jgi:signal transduction histidine kinase
MAASGELLQHPRTDPEGMKDVGARVSRGAALMSRMVEDLVEYTRTQLGSRMPVSLEELDVRQACTRAVEDASAAFPRAQFEVDTNGSLRGCFDDVRLHQLLTNLLTNAAQYGSEGRPITISARRDADRIVIRVMNHGLAIPEASWRSIFKPLVQLQDQEKSARTRTSLGLGLFVAREIALAHGGDISVESTMATGTTFTVRLPLRSPAT